MDFYRNKSALVTGGTGSIGSEIVRQLLSRGLRQVVVFSRDEIKQFLMASSIEDEHLRMYMGDIRDLESVREVFEKFQFDMIFHAAAMKHLVVCEDEPMEAVKRNVIGTDNLLRMARLYKLPNLVTISTDKAASPACVMGATKFIGEQITVNAALDSGNSYCCVRFGNVANSRASVIPIMIRRIIDGKRLWISDPDVTRFIMRISDAVKLVLDACTMAKGGEKFILKMKMMRLGELADTMTERIYPRFHERAAQEVEVRELARGEKLHEELLNTNEYPDVLENDHMFLIPRYGMSAEEAMEAYPGFGPAQVEIYKSDLAAEIDRGELEAIISEYIKSERYG